MPTYTTYRQILQDQPFPYACLDLALLRQNITINRSRAGDKKIRLASKSIRCVEVLRLLLAADAQFQGIMAYHGEEALALAQAGFDDLLLGYPVVDPALLRQLGQAVQAGTYLCLMADEVRHLELANAAGAALGVRMPVCLDIDLSQSYPGLHFGVWRSGIRTLPDLERILEYLNTLPYVRLDGLMGYEAQLAGVGDDTPGQYLKNAAIRWLQKRARRPISTWRAAAVAAIEAHGFQLRFVNGGGTGSLETTRQEAVVTEVTVGSGFYAPHLFDHYRHFQLHPALFYGVPVVRQPRAGIFTCHGGGFVASGGIGPAKAPVVYLPPGGQLDPHEGAGEVQTPVFYKHPVPALQPGDPIFFRHAKAGELCEHFNHLLLLDGETVHSVPTYRGQGWSFG
ncbi:MAG: amino acid aldolase [Bacteroidetes bacterium]|nr:MAG: amino acid aldolase [Bacteroidota bacterium]PTM09333.1 MAG: amino acid aldolase [Bacteroidota bacterium]